MYKMTCTNCGKKFISDNPYAKYCVQAKSPTNFKTLLKKYNLTEADYERLFAESNCQCGICGKSPDILFIDHNHVTNVVRGLLCVQCNGCLSGYLWDNEKLVEKAYSWVKRGLKWQQ